MNGKKTVSLKLKKGLAAHIKDRSSPFELNPEEKIEIAKDVYERLNTHSVLKDNPESGIGDVVELLGYLAPDTLIESSPPVSPKTSEFIDSKLTELRMIVGQIVMHMKNAELVGLVKSAVQYGSVCQEIRMAVSYGKPMLLGIINTKATSDGGIAKLIAKGFIKKRPKYQPFIDDYIKKNPHETHTAAVEAAAEQFKVSIITIRRHTKSPKSLKIKK